MSQDVCHSAYRTTISISSFLFNRPMLLELLLVRVGPTKQNVCGLPNTIFTGPASGLTSRRHLRSTRWRFLFVLCYWLSIFAWRAFFVTGPSLRTSLPDYLRDIPVSRDTLGTTWTCFRLQHTDACGALQVLCQRGIQIYFFLFISGQTALSVKQQHKQHYMATSRFPLTG